MMNYTDQLLEKKKRDVDVQKGKTKAILRVVLAALLPILLCIAIVSLPELSKAIHGITLTAVIGLIIGSSLTSGLLEHMKTKKIGKRKLFILLCAQGLLLLIYTLMLFYIELFK